MCAGAPAASVGDKVYTQVLGAAAQSTVPRCSRQPRFRQPETHHKVLHCTLHHCKFSSIYLYTLIAHCHAVWSSA